MFARKLFSLDLSSKFSLGCCCLSKKYTSPDYDKDDQKPHVNPQNKESDAMEIGSKERKKKKKDKSKNKKDGDILEEKNSEGRSYDYNDSESSSDSDDEVLKRYQSTLKHANSVKRSNTTQSIRSNRVAIIKEKKGANYDSLNSLVDENKSPADSSSYDEDRGSHQGGYTVNPHLNGEERERHFVSPEPSTASVSMHGSQPGLVYENKAFQEEQMSAMSSSEQLSLPGAMGMDEHLFDVSDLDKEPPLISKCGSLEMTFSYDANRGRMSITIHQAQEIPSKERGGASNSQVRILLLPTKKQRYKTKVKSGENPAYSENFVFSKIRPEEVHGMGIRIRLYGMERMRRERMIGESIIGFASLNLDVTSTHWIILEPRSNLSGGDSRFDVSSLSRSDSASSTQSMQHGGMPELLLGLAYNGTTGRLSVEVIKGSNFRNMAMTRAPDTYVKLTLMSPTGQEVSRSKTSIRRGQPNPLFKETFMFQVALFQLADVTLMVSVYNKRSMKKKDMIGWFSLGLNSSGEEELSHWSDMRESKGDQVCRWHVLLES